MQSLYSCFAKRHQGPELLISKASQCEWNMTRLVIDFGEAPKSLGGGHATWSQQFRGKTPHALCLLWFRRQEHRASDEENKQDEALEVLKCELGPWSGMDHATSTRAFRVDA